MTSQDMIRRTHQRLVLISINKYMHRIHSKMHKASNDKLGSNMRLSLSSCNAWVYTLVLAVIATTTTTIHCNGYTVVPQLQTAPSQRHRQHWRSDRRDNDNCIVIAKGSGSDSNSATTALPTNMINTLDGQEIRQEIIAMNNIIFVKVKEALSTTLGGIVIPDQSKQRPTEGTVVASGPGKIHPHTGKRISNPISVGMNVI